MLIRGGSLGLALAAAIMELSASPLRVSADLARRWPPGLGATPVVSEGGEERAILITLLLVDEPGLLPAEAMFAATARREIPRVGYIVLTRHPEGLPAWRDDFVLGPRLWVVARDAASIPALWARMRGFLDASDEADPVGTYHRWREALVQEDLAADLR